MDQKQTVPAKGEKKLFTGIDLLRLPCAVLVVFLHTYSYDWGRAGAGIKYVLSSVGVPFFFIVSGFFIAQGLIKSSTTPDTTPGAYIKRYFVRTLIMYTLWTLLSMPASLYNISLAHPEYNVIMIIISLFRNFFLVGSIGIYWYLLALIYNCLVLFLMFKKPKLEIPVFIISVLLFAFGVLYESGIALRVPGLSLAANLLHVLFGSERNFLTVGLFYMCIGFFFARHPFKLPPMPLLLVLLAAAFGLKTAEFLLADRILQICVCQLFTSVALFLVGLGWSVPIKKETAMFIRKFSSGLYFLHFPFIILFDYYLHHSTLINFPVTLLFASGVYLLCRFLLPKKINGYLFG